MQTLHSGDYITPLLLNILNSTKYVICEYDQDGEAMMFLHQKYTFKSYNLKGGFLGEEGNPLVLRLLDLVNDTFYYIKEKEYVKGSNKELNPVNGIIINGIIKHD